MLAFCLIILLKSSPINAQSTLIGDEVWYDDFNYSSSDGWILYPKMVETKFDWIPIGDEYRNISFWGPLSVNESTTFDFSRAFRCSSATRSLTYKYKTAVCGYREPDDMDFYLYDYDADTMELVLMNGANGTVNGTSKEGYSMLPSLFGVMENASGQNINLNTICADNYGGNRFWVQEWEGVYHPNNGNIDANKNFAWNLRAAQRENVQGALMIFDISLNCDKVPEPTKQPTATPTSSPTSSCDDLSAALFNISVKLDEVLQKLNE